MDRAVHTTTLQCKVAVTCGPSGAPAQVTTRSVETLAQVPVQHAQDRSREQEWQGAAYPYATRLHDPLDWKSPPCSQALAATAGGGEDPGGRGGLHGTSAFRSALGAVPRALARGQMSFPQEPARRGASWQRHAHRSLTRDFAAKTSVAEHLPSRPASQASCTSQARKSSLDVLTRPSV